jgi:tetratricopeptide (TPR) repeat protein
MASILVVGVVVWFLPAYVLGWSGGDWKAWLVVGPLATVVVVIMVAGSYGLSRRSRETSGPHRAGSPQDQKPDGSPLTEMLSSEDIEELLQELGEGAGTASLQAAQHLATAYALVEGSEFRDALRECSEAIRFDPGCAEAHNLRGIVLEELGHVRAAVSAYRHAVRLDLELSEARENLSELESQLRGRTKYLA